jgi:hypothetical protein
MVGSSRRRLSHLRAISLRLHQAAVFLLLFCIVHGVVAGPTTLGITGYVNMPNARIAEEGTLRFGLSKFDPYTAFWSSLSMFPRLELGARYTATAHTVGIPGTDYGTYKDKAFDAKLMLLRESRYLPEVSIGTQDFLGTRLYAADFVAMNKQVGDFDLGLGYGQGRIDGYFGGIRYQPRWNKDLSFVYEYDAFDYPHDLAASVSGAIHRTAHSTYGIEYRYGWLGSQLSYQGGKVGINAYVAIPLMQAEFIPKLDEPPPYTKQIQRPTLSEWRRNPQHQLDLIRALEGQGYQNVQVVLSGAKLEIGFAHGRITLVGRAVGRAARTALLMGPVDMDRMEITYFTLTDLAVVSYEFTDLPLLDRFFRGQVTYGQLLRGLTVRYADPDTARRLSGTRPTGFQPQGEPLSDELRWEREEQGGDYSLKLKDATLGQLSFIPFNMGIFFNDPNGAFRYDISAIAKYSRRMARGLFLDSSLRLSLLEDVSQVSDTSNSTLPHVRTDVGDYKRASRFKLNNLLLNKFFQLRPRLYGRASVGYYEEMYGGGGGQLLYLPKEQNWAVDFTVDRLRQRDVDGGFGFREYVTTTALAAVHYRIPKYGLTLTARVGQFLAKDKGIRYEIQRRFRSGIRVGAWYTYTDGNDITPPGSPDNPYHDKGVFLSIPLSSMLTKDTRATARFAIAPWTRDVGAMVSSPADLYTIMEDPLMLDWPGRHLLSDFHR